jgi:hypothetical protein
MLKRFRDRWIPEPGEGYPLSVFDYRTLPKGYEGPVHVWDIDKTYLSTHFSSLGGLGRIPLEFAVDKEAIPGMPAVLRGLRRGAAPEYACVPLYFVTGSPPFLRSGIEERMLMDGVEYDGIIFKDWMKTLRHRRPGRLKEQVGYKVCALLTGRISRPRAAEYLFGDDVEQDALAFDLYARILEGGISAGETVSRLIEAGVPKADRKNIFTLLDRLPLRRGPVNRIFIHLARSTPPEMFDGYGERVLPVRSSYQLALALYELSLTDRQTVEQTHAAVFGAADDTEARVREEADDALERGLISEVNMNSLNRHEPAPS